MSNYTGGVLNRRKRALDRNERLLKVSVVNLEKVKSDMDKHEKDPSYFDASKYRVLISQGVVYDKRVKRLVGEIETLKSRV